MTDWPYIVDWFKEYWLLVSLAATCGLTLMETYRKIPKIEVRVKTLEDKKKCDSHDLCFKSLEVKISSLDTKFCKELGNVNKRLENFEKTHEKESNKLFEELKNINRSIGRLEGRSN